MATGLDILALRNMQSGAIAQAEAQIRANRIRRATSAVYDDNYESSFANVFDKVLQNISTTNAYLSDAENEEIRWAIGEAESTHQLTIALQKAQTALQYTIAIRDRALQAYNQIMQMQI